MAQWLGQEAHSQGLVPWVRCHSFSIRVVALMPNCHSKELGSST